MANTNPLIPSNDLLAWIDRHWSIDTNAGIITSYKRGRIGCYRTDDYEVVTANFRGNRRQIYTHHLVWWKYYGRWPIMQLDHKDLNRKNNKISNLREVTHSEQMLNRSWPNVKGF